MTKAEARVRLWQLVHDSDASPSGTLGIVYDPANRALVLTALGEPTQTKEHIT